MTPTEASTIESAVGVSLPEPYRLALTTHELSGEWEDHPEFITDAATLVAQNRHFKMNAEDLSEYRSVGMLGAIKFFLIYGSGKRLLATRRQWFKKWVAGRRFIIGNDLGEEQYYIVLTETEPRVYCYELESHQCRVIAPSIQQWLVEVKRRQVDAESEI